MAKRKSKIKKINKHNFRDKLLLNQWLLSLFGINPLPEDRRKRPFHKLADILKNSKEGYGKNNLHNFFYELSNSSIFNDNKAVISKNQLLKYEENIVKHTQAINEKRRRKVIWKYYQWLSLLFVEIYLDYFFDDKEALLISLNEYVDKFNKYWNKDDSDIKYVKIDYFKEEELNKLSLQNATGSGKTLLMHVNFLQFRFYLKKYKKDKNLSNAILITPNERLTQQHITELYESNIIANRFAKGQTTTALIDVIEITKLGDKEGPTTIATRSLGDSNLLLVDEAHRGLSGKNAKSEENAWFKNRSMLSEKAFTFEYSATFDQAVSGTGHEDDYAKTVIFDYSYRWFYEDGFGKDYQILNLPDSFEETKNIYLTACLLKFYQQLDIYNEKTQVLNSFNMEKPLWVFVGSTVSGTKLGKDEKIAATDVAQIIAFIADFLSSREKACNRIEEILTGNGQDTGLLDIKGRDIFEGSFIWLSKKINSGLTCDELYQNILKLLFNTNSGGHLTLERVKGESGEIALRAGTSETPFGLINVGDSKSLADHIKAVSEKEKLTISVTDSDFSESAFESVKDSSSPVNLLIGSKKFVEGWDCWRVSTLGLMHVGKSEGAQIIQLFGRGVRLKGYNWSLKRSGHIKEKDVPVPIHMEELETLNVFGIEADFMDKFRQFLTDEGLPGNERRQTIKIPLNVTYDFGKGLKIIRPKYNKEKKREFNFKKDGPIPCIVNTHEHIRQHRIESDWYPKIKVMESNKTYDIKQKEEFFFEDKHLAFLDIDKLYFELEEFKRERGWYNLNIDKSGILNILKDSTWYTLYVPEIMIKLDNFENIIRLQQIALELLKGYTNKYYDYCHRQFIEPRLELRVLSEDDNNIPEKDEDRTDGFWCDYHLIVDDNEDGLISSIEKLKKDLAENKKDLIHAGDINACRFNSHLFQPLIHLRKGSKITILPVGLNESEFQFVKDIKEWYEIHGKKLEEQKTELYLLRNLSRGKGAGFFEAGNFHPDFILWMVIDKKQYITFIEPHGLVHEGLGSSKIQFYKRIKEIEKRLNDTDVVLNSFIISATEYPKLMWNKTRDELENEHVLFMKDDKNQYIEKLFKILKPDKPVKENEKAAGVH